ncbi:MAG: zinc ABC transporter substrate-binding protein [Patescibacteria group bacterium]
MPLKQSFLIPLLTLATLTLVLTLFLHLKRPSSLPSTNNSTTHITTSFYPLQELSSRIGGTLVTTTNLTPPGAEPHDFEPTAQDIARIYTSDLFLYNGGGIDAWATKIAPDVQKQNVLVLELATSVDLLPSLEEPFTFDEHFWLDPLLAIKEAEAIRDLLIKVDPTHQDTYNTNTNALIADLKNLDTQYRTALASCEIRTVVTSHAAFGYLAKEYNFVEIPITGLSPDAEPSAGDLARITREAKTAGVKYIFFESLVSPKLAQTLASEIQAQTLVFNPIEGLTQEELDAHETYFTVMQKNLESLKTAMVCQ